MAEAFQVSGSRGDKTNDAAEHRAILRTAPAPEGSLATDIKGAKAEGPYVRLPVTPQTPPQPHQPDPELPPLLAFSPVSRLAAPGAPPHPLQAENSRLVNTLSDKTVRSLWKRSGSFLELYTHLPFTPASYPSLVTQEDWNI